MLHHAEYAAIIDTIKVIKIKFKEAKLSILTEYVKDY